MIRTMEFNEIIQGLRSIQTDNSEVRKNDMQFNALDNAIDLLKKIENKRRHENG